MSELDLDFVKKKSNNGIKGRKNNNPNYDMAKVAYNSASHKKHRELLAKGTTAEEEREKKRKERIAQNALTDTQPQLRTQEALDKNQTNRQITLMVRSETNLAVKDAITQVDENGIPWFKNYINKVLTNALNDTASKESEWVSRMIFKEDLLEQLERDVIKNQIRDRDFLIYRLSTTLFDKQLEVFNNNYLKSALIICGRRSGKTELNARLLVKHLAKGNSKKGLYLNKTFKNAISQMFKLIVDLADKIDFGIKKADESKGFIEFQNGSTLQFGGVGNKAEIDKYRGFKYNVIIVDEVGHIKNGNILVDEVLKPTTIDFADAVIYFTGTPPRIKNFASKLWESKIKKYRWTFLDNPFIPNKENVIKEVTEERGLSVDDPLIKREYFGDMEAFDNDAMIFRGAKFVDVKDEDIKRVYRENDQLDNTTKNLLYKVPNTINNKNFRPQNCYIGVDFGWSANNAIVGIITDNINCNGVIVYEDVFNKASVSDIVDSIKECVDFVSNNYGIKMDDIKIYGDNSDQSIIAELIQTYHLNAYPCYKYNKMAAFSLLAEKTRSGDLLSIPNGALAEEYTKTVYERDEATDELVAEIDDDLFHPNAAFALLYASRQIFYDWNNREEQVKKEEKDNDINKEFLKQLQARNGLF